MKIIIKGLKNGIDEVSDAFVEVKDKNTAEYMYGKGNFIIEGTKEYYEHPLYKESLTKEVINITQNLIDKTAQEKGYDNGMSCASYAGYENPFQEEAVKFGKWRSDVWNTLYALKSKDDNSSTIDEIIDSLPKFTW